LGIGNSCLGQKPKFGADYRHAQPRRKPGLQARLSAPMAMNCISAPTGIA
jgi:hypothetical protein